MIRKLRFKFVLINMSIVTLMLATILGLVFYFTRANLESESINMMQGIAAQPFQLGIPSEQGEDVRLPFFTIQLGPRGELAATGGGYYDLSDGEFLRSLIETAYSSPKKLGVIEEYHLRYYRSDNLMSPCVVAMIGTHSVYLVGCIGTQISALFRSLTILSRRLEVCPIHTILKSGLINKC